MFSRQTIQTALGLVATGSLVAGAPCDIYAAGGTPCAVAHATTRALFSNYTGPLYQVKRASDSTTLDIKPGAHGIANSAAQDTFCRGTTCVITIIYDQTGHMHLTQAPPGTWKGPAPGGYDNLASATGAPIYLNGQKVYGVFSDPGTGYRNNKPNGTAKGDEPEGIYAIVDGTHYGKWCCFDYGNAETTSTDTGPGTMEAIYFGASTQWGYGTGKGPWIMGDLENGMFSGTSHTQNNDPTITWRFVTAIVKGRPGNHWAIKGANAQSGALSYFFNGSRPDGGYNPMKKEGAVILGTGGDNSNSAAGTFYEGAMTTGYPTDATEDAVQADIVAAKYTTNAAQARRDAALAALHEGAAISLGALAADGTTQYLAHAGGAGSTVVAAPIPVNKKRASWTVRTGLGRSECVSIESADMPGSYIRKGDEGRLALEADDGTKEFGEDATFCPEAGLAGRGVSLRLWNYPKQYVRAYDGVVYAAHNGGVRARDAAAGFTNDVTWTVETALV